MLIAYDTCLASIIVIRFLAIAVKDLHSVEQTRSGGMRNGACGMASFFVHTKSTSIDVKITLMGR